VIGGFEIEPIPQIFSCFQDAHQECAIGIIRHHRLDQVELIHRHQLQNFGARFSGAVARQRLNDLNMLWRFWASGCREFVAQLRFQRDAIGLDKGI